MPVFLANPFLWFSLVALVPLALHLLHRRRPKPIAFAAVRFLMEAISSSRRSRRVTQTVTLLMRMLLVFLLAIAFARPLVKFSRFVPGNHRTLVLVLDSSASMQAHEGSKTLFEMARSWAEVLVNDLEEGDRVAILAPGAPDAHVIFPPVTDREAILTTLRGLQPGYGYADLTQTLAALLNDSENLRGAELHLFSDFQTTTWPAEQVASLREKLRKAGVAVFFNREAVVTSGDALVEGVDFAPPALIGDAGTSATARLRANAQFAGATVLRVTSGVAELNHSSLELMPSEQNRLALPLNPPQEDGQFTGCVQIDEDAFALNDRFFFSLPRVLGVPVLVVNGTSSRDSFFLTRALRPGGRGAAAVEPVAMDWAGFLSADLSMYPLVMLCNPPDLGEAALGQIRRAFASGATVVLFPGDAGGLTEEGLHAFEELANVKVTREDFPEAKRLEVLLGDRQQSLVRRMESILPPPWSAPARSRLAFSVPSASGIAPFVYGEQGAFALAVQPRQGGALWVFGTSANRDWADFPITPFYLVLMQELAKNSAGGGGRSLSTFVGDALLLPWPGDSLNVRLNVTDQQGRVKPRTFARHAVGEPLLLGDFHTPGIYTVSDGTHTVRLAVNIPRAEMLLEYLPSEGLPQSLPDVPCHYSANTTELRRQVESTRLGSPLWPALLLGALILSMVEVLFANFRSRPARHSAAMESVLGGGAK